MNYKNGDRVELSTTDEKYVGMVLPRPEILKGDYLVLKLDNGYNIGIDKQKIKEIKVVKNYEKKQKTKLVLKHNKNLPTVSFISTGGTISSRIDYHTGGVIADYDAQDFVSMCPELEKIANLKVENPLNIMSEDFNFKHFKKIASVVVKELNKNGVDGVVITMGTDMLHFATAALSFFIKDINKPVIITASQRSIDRGSSDAFMNLICSVYAAGNFDYSGIASCLHGTTDDDYCLLIRGTKVRKMHTSRRDAFRPVNEKPLAKVYPKGEIEIIGKNIPIKKETKAVIDDKYEKAALIYVYPDMDPEIIDFYVKKGYKGIVIAGTALGHVPTNTEMSLFPNIKKAIEKGVAVVISSQTIYGRTHPLVYTNLRKLSVELKCIFSEDMLPEVTYIKLAWVLGHTKDIKKISEMMNTNYAGEINLRHSDVFLD